jgi:hypothetical protein
MSVLEGVRNLDGVMSQRLAGQWTQGKSFAQRPPFHEFHCQIVSALVFSDFVENRNPRMIQCGHGARLAFKTRDPVFIAGKFCRQYLEGDPPRQAGIFRQIDHAHPAGTKLREDAILRDLLTDHVRTIPPLGQGC